MNRKQHIGNSVYVEFCGGAHWYTVKLTTQSGHAADPTNAIVLEPHVYKDLVEFVDHMKEIQRKLLLHAMEKKLTELERLIGKETA